jgi:hypothetical protein
VQPRARRAPWWGAAQARRPRAPRPTLQCRIAPKAPLNRRPASEGRAPRRPAVGAAAAPPSAAARRRAAPLQRVSAAMTHPPTNPRARPRLSCVGVRPAARLSAARKALAAPRRGPCPRAYAAHSQQPRVRLMAPLWRGAGSGAGPAPARRARAALNICTGDPAPAGPAACRGGRRRRAAGAPQLAAGVTGGHFATPGPAPRPPSSARAPPPLPPAGHQPEPWGSAQPRPRGAPAGALTLAPLKLVTLAARYPLHR